MPGEKNKKIMSDMVAAKPSFKVLEKRVVPMRRTEQRPPPKLGGVVPTAARNRGGIPEVYLPPTPSYIGGGAEQPRRPYFLWLVSMACIVALVIGIGGLFAHATITLQPKVFSGTVNATVNFSQGHETGTVFFATATKTFSDEIIVPSTGSVEKESKATGKVRLYNANATSKTIPAGTKILSSQDVAYQTAKSVTVGAKKGTTPGSVDVGVLAVESGAQGNTDPDDFTFVNVKGFPNITIKSATAITGGAKAADAIADPAAVATATETLQGRFADPATLVARMGEGMPDDFIMLPISITPSAPSIISETNHPDGVHVIARQTVGMIMAKKSDIARVIGNQLSADKAIPLTMDSFEDATFITSTPMAPSSIPTQFSAHMSGTANIFGDIDTATIPQQIAGKSRADAKKLFDQHPEIQSSKIRMVPPWRRVFPMDVGDIEIVAK